GVRVPWNRDLTGGRAGDDVCGLTGDDAEDGDPTSHERIELRRHGAFVGFERTETDESGIGPLPMGGQLRPCVLRIELDGNTVLSCHRLELGCVDATADDAQTHTLGPGQGADRGAQILGTSDGADVEQVETAAGGSGTVFRSVGCGL